MLPSRKLRSAVLIVLGALSMSAHAAEEAMKRIAVPAGPLTLALKSLAEQSGVEFFYATDQLEGLKTEGVQGEYTAEKAVMKLLEGTNFKLTRHESGAFVITVSETAAAVERGAIPKRLRLAQADAPTGNDDSTIGRRLNADGRDQTRIELQEVIVVGSRLGSSQNESAQPVKVLNRDDIDRTGLTSVSEVMSTLPEVSVQAPEVQMFASSGTIRLRGLPLGSTLVL